MGSGTSKGQHRVSSKSENKEVETTETGNDNGTTGNPTRVADNETNGTTGNSTHVADNGTTGNPTRVYDNGTTGNPKRKTDNQGVENKGPGTHETEFHEKKSKEENGHVNQENDNKDTDNEDDESTQGEAMTPEDIHSNTMNELKKRFELLKHLGHANYRDDTGNYHNYVKAVVVIVYQAYFAYSALNNVTLDKIVEHRLTIAKLLLENKIVELWCEIVINSFNKQFENDEIQVSLFDISLGSIHNYSDASEEISTYVADYPGFLELLKQVLLDNKESHLNGTQDETDFELTQSCYGVIHNISMSESNITRLRGLDYTAVLQPYLKVKEEINRLAVLASLAGIINEDESEIINSNEDIVIYLLNVLREGLDTNEHRYNGWSCKECCLTVRMLARNDANKKLLVEVGALELLVKLGQTGNLDEQCESVGAIWALAFDEENGQNIVESEFGAVDLLLKLKSSPNSKIKNICNGALWTLREHLTSSEKYKDIGEALTTVLTHHKEERGQEQSKYENDEEDEGHIMISYQWVDQPTLIKIRDRLKAAGYKVSMDIAQMGRCTSYSMANSFSYKLHIVDNLVDTLELWMDIDEMGGSTLQSMAEGIEGAKVVLICYSQKYKNSPNCRAEAEYAFKINKEIVPLNMERGYQPDGWLGIMCGSKLFYEFSGKYEFEDKIVGLLKELTITLRRKSQTREIKPEKALVVHHPPAIVTSYDMVDTATANHPVTRTTSVVSRATVKTVRSWTNIDVQKWIDHHNLQSCGLKRLSGDDIALLMTLRFESPDFFYKCLQDMLKVRELSTLSKIVWAITELAEST